MLLFLLFFVLLVGSQNQGGANVDNGWTILYESSKDLAEDSVEVDEGDCSGDEGDGSKEENG